jgi:hypothetical protein
MGVCATQHTPNGIHLYFFRRIKGACAHSTPATMPPVPQANTAPPTLPPLSPGPINPRHSLGHGSMGYRGPVTADNINELLRRANEIRSSLAVRRGRARKADAPHCVTNSLSDWRPRRCTLRLGPRLRLVTSHRLDHDTARHGGLPRSWFVNFACPRRVPRSWVSGSEQDGCILGCMLAAECARVILCRPEMPVLRLKTGGTR